MKRATAIALAGMSAALAAAQISPYLARSRPAMGGAEGALLEVVGAAAAAAGGEVVLLFVAVLAAVAFLYVHIHNGGGAGNRRILEVVHFLLSVSVGLLVVSLLPYPGAMNRVAEAQAPSLGEFALHAMLPFAALTFHLSVALVYAHVRAGGAGAGDGPIQPDVAVEILAKMSIGATLVSFMAILLAFYARHVG